MSGKLHLIRFHTSVKPRKITFNSYNYNYNFFFIHSYSVFIIMFSLKKYVSSLYKGNNLRHSIDVVNT